MFPGSLRGYLRKKGKEDNSWNLRLFVLSAADNSLAYYIRDQVYKLSCLEMGKIGQEFLLPLKHDIFIIIYGKRYSDQHVTISLLSWNVAK